MTAVRDILRQLFSSVVWFSIVKVWFQSNPLKKNKNKRSQYIQIDVSGKFASFKRFTGKFVKLTIISLSRHDVCEDML